jgi:hypothetical protein
MEQFLYRKLRGLWDYADDLGDCLSVTRLYCVNICEFTHRLQFHNHVLCDNKVKTMSANLSSTASA